MRAIQDASIAELIFELQRRSEAGVVAISLAPHETGPQETSWDLRKTAWGDPAARLGLATAAVNWELKNIFDSPTVVIDNSQEDQL